MRKEHTSIWRQFNWNTVVFSQPFYHGTASRHLTQNDKSLVLGPKTRKKLAQVRRSARCFFNFKRRPSRAFWKLHQEIMKYSAKDLSEPLIIWDESLSASFVNKNWKHAQGALVQEENNGNLVHPYKTEPLYYETKSLSKPFDNQIISHLIISSGRRM